MFDLNVNNNLLNEFKCIKIINGPIIQNEIETIMKNEDFIFCKSYNKNILYNLA